MEKVSFFPILANSGVNLKDFNCQQKENLKICHNGALKFNARSQRLAAKFLVLNSPRESTIEVDENTQSLPVGRWKEREEL